MSDEKGLPVCTSNTLSCSARLQGRRVLPTTATNWTSKWELGKLTGLTLEFLQVCINVKVVEVLQHGKSTEQHLNIWRRTQSHKWQRIIKLFIYHTTMKMYTLQRCVVHSGNNGKQKRSSHFCNCTGVSTRKGLGGGSAPLLPSVQSASSPGTQSSTRCQVTKFTLLLQLFTATWR